MIPARRSQPYYPRHASESAAWTKRQAGASDAPAARARLVAGVPFRLRSRFAFGPSFLAARLFWGSPSDCCHGPGRPYRPNSSNLRRSRTSAGASVFTVPLPNSLQEMTRVPRSRSATNISSCAHREAPYGSARRRAHACSSWSARRERSNGACWRCIVRG